MGAEGVRSPAEAPAADAVGDEVERAVLGGAEHPTLRRRSAGRAVRSVVVAFVSGTALQR
jgi:hypothetical protein